MSNVPITWPTGVVAVTQRSFLPPGQPPVVHAMKLDAPRAATACGRTANSSTELVEPSVGPLCSICAGWLARNAPESANWSAVAAHVQQMLAEVARMRAEVDELRRLLDDDASGWAA